MQPEPLTNDNWKKIVNHPASHQRGWPTFSFPLPPPPPINLNAQISHVVSPVQSSHDGKRLKIDVSQPVLDNRKVVASPSSPSTKSSKSVSSRLHIKYDCSHVINAIHPRGSNQARATPEKSRGDNNEKRKYASHNNKYGF
jgi:hypothetical protein